MSRSSSGKRPSYLIMLFILIVSAGLCMFTLTAKYVFQNAIQSFGTPSENISLSQKYYLSAQLFIHSNELKESVNPDADAILFTISPGEPLSSVIEHLWNKNLISNPGAFKAYLVYSGIDTKIQAGEHKVSGAMTPIEIAETLQGTTPTELNFIVLAGWRIEEIADTLPTSGLVISPEEFIKTAKNKSAEGYLFPGSYVIPREASTEILINTLIKAFYESVIPEIQEGIKSQNLSLEEAITLASIVEREAVKIDEMPIIASVFLNRLAVGMKLESDPTVQYGLGYIQLQETWWKNPLTHEDFGSNSPHNTYLYPGLPPTPICNPSLEAIRAVAFPAQTPYFYFRAACDDFGGHTFAKSLNEHINNECP